jgi:hypothetical protein
VQIATGNRSSKFDEAAQNQDALLSQRYARPAQAPLVKVYAGKDELHGAPHWSIP